MNAVERKSLGTIYFPVSVLILCLFFWDKPISFFIAVSVLTFADPIASVVGSKSRNHFYPWKDKKSVEEWAKNPVHVEIKQRAKEWYHWVKGIHVEAVDELP